MKKRHLFIATSVLAATLFGTTTAQPGPAQGKGTGIYATCKAFNAKYPYGVRKAANIKNKVVKQNGKVEYRSTKATVSAKIYRTAMQQNTSLDRDKDGIACER
jgi:hypothetical protein